jgi:hypothetical protein
MYAKHTLDGAVSATVVWIGETQATHGGIAGAKIKIQRAFFGFSQAAAANTFEIIETHVVSGASSTATTFKCGVPGTSGAFWMDFEPYGIAPATQTATAVGYKIVQNSTGTLTAWFIGTTE